MALVLPANQVAAFDVTCPAGTAKTSPQTTSIGFQPTFVQRVIILIPDGHVGLTGIRLAIAGGQLLPITRDTWFSGNDRTVDMEVTDYPNSGAWQAITYNTGQYAHGWHIEFYNNNDPIFTPATSPAPVATPILV